MVDIQKDNLKKPEWLKKHFKNSSKIHYLKKGLRSRALHTVCESARCPNLGECFNKKTATFMIMGDTCTRSCSFCAVKHGTPDKWDQTEPNSIARFVAELDLRHVVITSVTRDDLPDGGASHFASTINTIRGKCGCVEKIEVLTPDFNGRTDLIKTVLDAGPDIFNHNIETVRRLSVGVRNNADYDRSLAVLRFAAGYQKNTLIKSGLMVGLGETDDEVLGTMTDLKGAGCSIVTVGQYLRPSRKNLAVERYVEPETFTIYKEYGDSIGIPFVFAGPFVRSSYMAGEILKRQD